MIKLMSPKQRLMAKFRSQTNRNLRRLQQRLSQLHNRVLASTNEQIANAERLKQAAEARAAKVAHLRNVIFSMDPELVERAESFVFSKQSEQNFREWKSLVESIK